MTDITVELVGNRIHLYSPPPWEMPGIKQMVKRVPGANWSPTKNAWTYPATMMTCRSLRRVFDDMLVVGPELSAWSRAAAADENARRRLCRAKIALVPEIRRYYHETYESMRGYQRVGARYMAGRPSLLADQPGLGKTLQYLTSLVEGERLEGVHLICAPKTSLTAVWVGQVERWLGMEAVAITGSAAQRHAQIDAFFEEVERYPPSEGYAHFMVINPEMLQIKTEKVRNSSGKEVEQEMPAKFPQLTSYEWTSVVVDEAQKYLLGIQNATRVTQTARGLLKVGKSAGHKTVLTGTPMKGKPQKLWSLLHWLYPDQYRSFWQWVETYFTVSDNGFGKEISEEPSEEMREIFYADLDTVMLRRTKGEVLKQLPPKLYNDEWVEMTSGQERQYNEMMVHAEADMGGTQVSATGVLAELTRLSQIASAKMDGDWVESIGDDGRPRRSFRAQPTGDSGKFLRLMEMLEERGVTGKAETSFGEMKFVVASQYTESLKFLETWFRDAGIPTLAIHGGISGGARTAAQAAFQTPGGARVMLINTATAQAIDLDAQCDEMFILDETFVPDDQEQLEDRIHRASRIHQVTIHYLRTRGTIDEARKTLVADKENLQKLILDGRRGVEFARKLINWKKE